MSLCYRRMKKQVNGYDLQSKFQFEREAVHMKKKTISFAVFLIVFIATYLIICFAIPGMRIKLEATPMEYFFKSITHMVFFKTMVSLAMALIFGAMLMVFMKKK